jgi:hypothetical protein
VAGLPNEESALMVSDVDLRDSSRVPEDATIEVTYKIKGAKDGPIVGSTMVTNQTEYDVNTEYLDTRSRSSKLTVVVTPLRSTDPGTAATAAG